MGAIFSKLTSGPLTNTGVQQPGPTGSTQYFPDPASATAAASKQLPSADSMISGDVNNPTVSVPPLPKVVQPTFAEAQDKPGALTTKGTAVKYLLTAMAGAAAGAEAGQVTNPHISPGLGGAMAAGFNTPFRLAQQRNALTQEQLEQEKEKAQIAALPQQAQTELDLKKAQTTWYNQRGEAVGEHNLKAGDTLVDKDGNVIGQGASVQATAQAKQTGKDAATSAAVQNLGGTTAQVLSALGVRSPTEKNTTTAQMYLNAAGGDPGKAIKSMNADRLAHATTLHTLIASLRSTASSDNATVKSDPQYSALTKQRDGLLAAANHELATGELDPNSGATVARLQAQANSLTQQMSNRRAQLVKPGAGAGSQQTKMLDAATATAYLQKAGGDKNKARQLATADGYSF